MELNKIYNMDALEGLRQLPDNSVDLILTDPPYNITRNDWDQFKEEEFLLFTELWLNECFRISKGGYLLMFWSQQKLNLIYKLHTKWLEKRIIIWNMPNAPISNNDGLIFTWQPCILYQKNEKGLVNNGAMFISSDVLIHNFSSNERFGHPTIKPLKLIKQLIEKYTIPGNIVLDVFMGSGTTAVACKQLGRQYIGFEKNKEYYELINKRLCNTSFISKLNNYF